MRVLYLMFVALMLSGKVCSAASMTSEDAAAAANWGSLDNETRIYLQLGLIAGGYQVDMINAALIDQELAAIKRFQAAHKFAQTAILDPGQIKALFDEVAPILQAWRLQRTMLPFSDYPMWVPEGFGIKQTETAVGPRFEAGAGRFALNMTYFKNKSLDGTYSSFVKIIKDGGGQISYNLKHNLMFYIQAYNKERLFSVMFLPFRKNLYGYFLTVDISDREIFGRRLEIAIASSFVTNVLHDKLPSPSIPSWLYTGEPEARPEPPAKQPSGDEVEELSGTGIALNSGGDILTNAHVVEKCRDIVVQQGTVSVPAAMTAIDKVNDLAILHARPIASAYPNFRLGIRLGESVGAFGYPLSGLLASSGNFTLGNVTALSGVGDDSRFLQVSTPVQPGNSGGPLLDANGNLVGIISSGLNALMIMQVSGGDVPQNVNFAIKASVAETFLESRGISIQSSAVTKPLAAPDLADAAKSFATFIKCNSASPSDSKIK